MVSDDCVKCMTRVPYGTLIATILCAVGVLAFVFSLYPAVRLTLRMFEDIFLYDLDWISSLQNAFFIAGALMGLFAIMLLVVGIFSTGSTRYKIYGSWKARLGGRIISVILMIILYVTNILWLGIFACLVLIVFVFQLWQTMCEAPTECIDLRNFYFLFPNGTDINSLNICEKRKIFCTDTVVYAGPFFILAFAASIFVIISLLHYMMCLAANYTRIKDHEKIKDLQELQFLQGSEMGTLPKDRF